jgi:hypothetical protein
MENTTAMATAIQIQYHQRLADGVVKPATAHPANNRNMGSATND